MFGKVRASLILEYRRVCSEPTRRRGRRPPLRSPNHTLPQVPCPQHQTEGSAPDLSDVRCSIAYPSHGPLILVRLSPFCCPRLTGASHTSTSHTEAPSCICKYSTFAFIVKPLHPSREPYPRQYHPDFRTDLKDSCFGCDLSTTPLSLSPAIAERQA